MSTSTMSSIIASNLGMTEEEFENLPTETLVKVSLAGMQQLLQKFEKMASGPTTKLNESRARIIKNQARLILCAWLSGKKGFPFLDVSQPSKTTTEKPSNKNSTQQKPAVESADGNESPSLSLSLSDDENNQQQNNQTHPK